MSRVLTAKNICEESLGAIQAFPVTESAADGEHLRRAMTWLDLILAELVGSNRMFSRVTDTLTMPVTNGTQSYDLYETLGDDIPTDRIQFIVDAWLEDSAGRRHPLEVVSLHKFESVSNPGETGQPIWIHVDQGTNPTLKLYPTPAAEDPTTWSVKLRAQQFAPNVAPGGVTGTQPQGSVLHSLGQSWQRYLILQLSHDLGAGPIHKLPESSLNRFGAMAKAARVALEAFENREHVTTDPVCEGWGD